MIKDRVQKHVLMRKIHFHLNLTMPRYPVKILIRRISLNTAVELNWPIKRLFHVYGEVNDPSHFFDLKATQIALKLKKKLLNLDRFVFYGNILQKSCYSVSDSEVQYLLLQAS